MKNIIPKIIIVFFCFIALFGIVNSLFISKADKIYTLGKIYAKSSPGKTGSTYYFKYRIRDKEFKGQTNALYKFSTNENGYIFIEVISKDFSDYHVIEFMKVPACLTLDSVPKNGWTSLPEKNICN